MKLKQLIIISLLISATVINAQVKQQFGIQLGFEENLFRQNSLGNSKYSVAYNLNGPKVGFVYEVIFWKGIGLYTGINYSYSQLFMRSTPSMLNNYEVHTTTSFHNVSVPIHLEYKFTLAKNTWITIFTGPWFQYGINLHQTQVTQQPIQGLSYVGRSGDNYKYGYDFYRLGENTLLNKLSDADGDGRRDLNRFAPKWGIGGAFQFHQFYIRGGYNWGLINNYYDRTYTHLEDQTQEWVRKARFDQWFITLGWYFAYTEEE